MLGLRFCARAFSSCGKRGPLFIAVRGSLTIAASLVAEHRLQTRRLSSCGSRAQLLRGMWDLPRPGLEPVSPALAGRFSTTVPPGKSLMCILIAHYGKVDCEHGMGSVPGIFLPVQPPLDSPSHTVFIHSLRAVSNNCQSCFSKIPSVSYRVWHRCDCFGNGSSQEE